jgi:hypothetical protein
MRKNPSEYPVKKILGKRLDNSYHYDNQKNPDTKRTLNYNIDLLNNYSDIVLLA